MNRHVIQPIMCARGWSGHRWALPDVQHLRELLRSGFTNKPALVSLGNSARQQMLSVYSLSKFSDLLQFELDRIRKIVKNRIESSNPYRRHGSTSESAAEL